MRQACERTGEVGVGTTSAGLLAQATSAKALRNLVEGASAIALKRVLDRGGRVVGPLRAVTAGQHARRARALPTFCRRRALAPCCGVVHRVDARSGKGTAIAMLSETLSPGLLSNLTIGRTSG